jgi:hypothetical protein
LCSGTWSHSTPHPEGFASTIFSKHLPRARSQASRPPMTMPPCTTAMTRTRHHRAGPLLAQRAGDLATTCLGLPIGMQTTPPVRPAVPLRPAWSRMGTSTPKCPPVAPCAPVPEARMRLWLNLGVARATSFGPFTLRNAKAEGSTPPA